MERTELEQLILDRYGVEPDHPWARYPRYEVFRHPNGKWFALAMEVPRDKLGLEGVGCLDVVNLKCDGRLAGALRGEPGFFPAYHMNKESWITAALDGSAPDDQLKLLLELSYDATRPKPHRSRAGTDRP